MDKLDPVVQSIVGLTGSLMTNSLTVVAKVFLNTLIFMLQKKMRVAFAVILAFFQAKISIVSIKIKNLTSR